MIVANLEVILKLNLVSCKNSIPSNYHFKTMEKWKAFLCFKKYFFNPLNVSPINLNPGSLLHMFIISKFEKTHQLN